MNRSVAGIAVLVMTLPAAAAFAQAPVSCDLRAAAWEWTPGLLDTFLAAPRKAVGGTTMMFPGLKDPADRAAVVCYRAEASAQNVTTERIDSPRCIKSNASLILSSGI